MCLKINELWYVGNYKDKQNYYSKINSFICVIEVIRIYHLIVILLKRDIFLHLTKLPVEAHFFLVCLEIFFLIFIFFFFIQIFLLFLIYFFIPVILHFS